MNWTEFLRAEIEETYAATDGLMALVPADRLDWKPATGDNWMSTGQLLCHLTSACGLCIKGLFTGDWGEYAEVIEEASQAEADADDVFLPPAEALPTLESVDEARERLAADKAIALEILEATSEDALREETLTTPWDPRERTKAQFVQESIAHLATHKAQLFYYLKLLGEPVNTGHLWGMPGS
jgi:hypothetical protein